METETPIPPESQQHFALEAAKLALIDELSLGRITRLEFDQALEELKTVFVVKSDHGENSDCSNSRQNR